MQYSKTGEQLTEQFEGLRLTAYQDSVGKWTVGYGHTGQDVYPGLVITKAEAEMLLDIDITGAERVINQHVTVALTQGEFDALVDFVFNLGAFNFSRSTLLRDLNAGDYNGAAAQFERWSYAGAQKLAGLLRRRQAEEAEFNGPGTITS